MQPPATPPACFSLGSHQLARRMKARGLSQVQAARLIDQSQQQVQRLLAGLRRPGLEAAFRIQRVFGIRPEAWTRPPPRPRRRAA